MNTSSSNHTETTRMALNADQQRIHNMENAAIEASLACETRSVVERIRPINTIYAYIPKQEKFKVYLTYLISQTFQNIRQLRV